MLNTKKIFRKKVKDLGLAPGSLPDLPEPKLKPKITAIIYNEASYETKDLKSIADSKKLINNSVVSWINIDSISDMKLIEGTGAAFSLHPLILENIINLDQRPRFEDWGDQIYVCIKMIDYDKAKKDLKQEQVSLILGKDYIISFQEKEGDVFDAVRERIKKNLGRIRKKKADYLMHCLIDIIVDHYFIVLENLSIEVEAVEDEIEKNPNQENLSKIHNLKQKITFIRRQTWPIKELVNNLTKEESHLIDDSNQIYFKSVYEHSLHIVESVEVLRELITNSLDIYLSSVSNRMNEVMKVLTIIATIFMPITFIAGIYGMNFKLMPELEHPLGYPITIGVMVVIAIAMLFYFRNKKWI